MRTFHAATIAATIAASAAADSVTWTGAAGDGWWGTPSNWSKKVDIPSPSDTVTVADGVTINANANVMLPKTLELGAGTSVIIEHNELQMSGASAIRGGTVVANLIAAQSGGSSVTISDCALTNTSTGHVKGFYRHDGTAHLNFEFGTDGSASYTFPSSLVDGDSVYGTFVGIANPLIKFDGANLESESEFNETFEISTDAEAGMTTIFLKTPEGWKAAAPTLGPVEDGQVEVSYSVTRHSGGNATISIGCAKSDLGADIAAWAGKVSQVAADVADSVSGTETVTLSAGPNFIRVFVTYDGSTVASPAASATNLVYGEYGELTNVYEYIGTDNDLTKASNWALDKTPLAADAAAPTAGSDVRWFGHNAVISISGNFHLYSTDHFVGATLVQANADNHDSNLNGDVTFENSSVTLSTVVVQSEPHSISLKNSSFTTTRAPDGVAGFWTTVPAGGVNFVSGQPSSFTFGADAGDAHDAASVKTLLVDQGRITLDGAELTDTIWTEYFSVDESGTTVTVSYSPTVAENRIDGVSVVSTSSSATITATIGAQADGTLIKFAYGQTAPSETDVLAGTAMTVADGVASGTISGLEYLTVYCYLVAIVDPENDEVLVSKSGSFVASDYEYVYMDGAWIGGVPSLNTTSGILFLDNYNAVNGDVNVANKSVRGVTLRTGTLTGAGPLYAWSARISNTRDNDLVNAPYGIWNVTAPLFDFRSMSGDGTIRAACSYSFFTTHPDEDIATTFFAPGAPLILANGQAPAASNFSIETNATYNEGEESEYRNVSIVWWEPFPATTPDASWTMEDGARVKLSSNARTGHLEIPSGADAKIDTNGFRLRVTSLVVDGESLKGAFTAETLPSLVSGSGLVEVMQEGTVVTFR